MGLEALGLRKRFGKKEVVRGVSVSLDEGEIVGLLGPNGAGKTTTFYMLVGLERVDRGSIHIGGVDVTRLPIHSRADHGLGYLAQEPSVFRKLSVRDNVRAILEIRGVREPERSARANQLLEDFGLLPVSSQKGYSLSGGERRRVEIARALAASPRMLLLDEPFTGIDPIALADIQDIVRRLKELGIGVLITDHNVRETLAIVDRAYIMHDGEIIKAGDAADIANDPAARKLYLGDRFTL